MGLSVGAQIKIVALITELKKQPVAAKEVSDDAPPKEVSDDAPPNEVIEFELISSPADTATGYDEVILEVNCNAQNCHKFIISFILSL